MKNQLAKKHPNYPITPRMEKDYRDKVHDWRELIGRAKLNESHSCLNCTHYRRPKRVYSGETSYPIKEQRDEEGNILPWTSRQARVGCANYPKIKKQTQEVALRHSCPTFAQHEEE